MSNRELAYSAVSETDLLALRIHREAFYFVIEAHPDFAMALLSRLSADMLKSGWAGFGGDASGKTTAIRTIDQVQQAADSAQIVYDSTMRRHSSAQRRVRQALDADKSVSIAYVYTPIERSVRCGLLFGYKPGRLSERL